MTKIEILEGLKAALVAKTVCQADILILLHEADPDAGCLADIADKARDEYCTDEIEIDDKPLFSPGDDGCWVSAWVWVPTPEETG